MLLLGIHKKVLLLLLLLPRLHSSSDAINKTPRRENDASPSICIHTHTHAHTPLFVLCIATDSFCSSSCTVDIYKCRLLHDITNLMDIYITVPCLVFFFSSRLSCIIRTCTKWERSTDSVLQMIVRRLYWWATTPRANAGNLISKKKRKEKKGTRVIIWSVVCVCWERDNRAWWYSRVARGALGTTDETNRKSVGAGGRKKDKKREKLRP